MVAQQKSVPQEPETAAAFTTGLCWWTRVYHEPAKLLKRGRRVVLLITGADLVLVKMTKATTTAAHPGSLWAQHIGSSKGR